MPATASAPGAGEAPGRAGSDPNAGSGQTAEQLLAELQRTSLERLRVDAELGRAATGIPPEANPMDAATPRGQARVGLDRVFAEFGHGDKPVTWVGETEAFFPVSDVGKVLAEGFSPGRSGYVSGFTSLEQATRFGAGNVVVVKAPGFIREGISGEPMALFVGGAAENFVAGWHEISGDMSIYVEHSGFDPARKSVFPEPVNAGRPEAPTQKPRPVDPPTRPQPAQVVPAEKPKPPTPQEVQRGKDVTGLTAQKDPLAGAADLTGVKLDHLLAGFGKSANPPTFTDDGVAYVAVKEGSPQAPFVNGMTSKTSGVVVAYDSPEAARAAEGGQCRVYVVQGRRGRFEQELPNGAKAYLYVGGIPAHNFFGRLQSNTDTGLDVPEFADLPDVQAFVPNPGFDPDRQSEPKPAVADALEETARVAQLPNPADGKWQRRQDKDTAAWLTEALRPSEQDLRRGMQARGLPAGADPAPAAMDGRVVDPTALPASWGNPDAPARVRWLGEQTGPVVYVPLAHGEEVLFETGMVGEDTAGAVLGFTSLEKAMEFGAECVAVVDAPGGFIDEASGVVMLLDSVAGRYVVGKHVVSGKGVEAVSIFVQNPGFVPGRVPRKETKPPQPPTPEPSLSEQVSDLAADMREFRAQQRTQHAAEREAAARNQAEAAPAMAPTAQEVARGMEATGLRADQDPLAGAVVADGVDMAALVTGFGKSSTPPRYVEQGAAYIAVAEGNPVTPFVEGAHPDALGVGGVVVAYDSPQAARAALGAAGATARVYLVQGHRGRFVQGNAHMFVGGIAARFFMGRYQDDDLDLDVPDFQDMPAVQVFVQNPGFDPDPRPRPRPVAPAPTEPAPTQERPHAAPYTADPQRQRRAAAARLARRAQSGTGETGSGLTMDQVLAESKTAALEQFTADAALGRAISGLPEGTDPRPAATPQGATVGVDRVLATWGRQRSPVTWVPGGVEAFIPVSDLAKVLTEGITPAGRGYASGFTSLEQAKAFGADCVVVVKAPGFIRAGSSGNPTMALLVGGFAENFVAGWHEISADMSIYVENSAFDPQRKPRELPEPQPSLPEQIAALVADMQEVRGQRLTQRAQAARAAAARWADKPPAPTAQEVAQGIEATGLRVDQDPLAGAVVKKGVDIAGLLGRLGKSSTPVQYVAEGVAYIAVPEGNTVAPFVDGVHPDAIPNLLGIDGVVVAHDSPEAARAALGPAGATARMYLVQGTRGRFVWGHMHVFAGGIAPQFFLGRFDNDLAAPAIADMPAVQVFVANPGFDPDREPRPHLVSEPEPEVSTAATDTDTTETDPATGPTGSWGWVVRSTRPTAHATVPVAIPRRESTAVTTPDPAMLDTAFEQLPDRSGTAPDAAGDSLGHSVEIIDLEVARADQPAAEGNSTAVDGSTGQPAAAATPARAARRARLRAQREQAVQQAREVVAAALEREGIPLADLVPGAGRVRNVRADAWARARQLAALWPRLTPPEQAAFITAYPETVLGTAGLPNTDRIRAAHTVIDLTRIELGDEQAKDNPDTALVTALQTHIERIEQLAAALTAAHEPQSDNTTLTEADHATAALPAESDPTPISPHRRQPTAPAADPAAPVMIPGRESTALTTPDPVALACLQHQTPPRPAATEPDTAGTDQPTAVDAPAAELPGRAARRARLRAEREQAVHDAREIVATALTREGVRLADLIPGAGRVRDVWSDFRARTRLLMQLWDTGFTPQEREAFLTAYPETLLGAVDMPDLTRLRAARTALDLKRIELGEVRQTDPDGLLATTLQAEIEILENAVAALDGGGGLRSDSTVVDNAPTAEKAATVEDPLPGKPAAPDAGSQRPTAPAVAPVAIPGRGSTALSTPDPAALAGLPPPPAGTGAAEPDATGTDRPAAVGAPSGGLPGRAARRARIRAERARAVRRARAVVGKALEREGVRLADLVPGAGRVRDIEADRRARARELGILWPRLTEDERAAFITAYPDTVLAAAGLPAAVRMLASRTALDHKRIELGDEQQKNRDNQPDQPGADPAVIAALQAEIRTIENLTVELAETVEFLTQRAAQDGTALQTDTTDGDADEPLLVGECATFADWAFAWANWDATGRVGPEPVKPPRGNRLAGDTAINLAKKIGGNFNRDHHGPLTMTQLVKLVRDTPGMRAAFVVEYRDGIGHTGFIAHDPVHGVVIKHSYSGG
ncbi:hypothetical protein AB0H00_31680, partial [Nocardia sp. NPDC023852]